MLTTPPRSCRAAGEAPLPLPSLQAGRGGPSGPAAVTRTVLPPPKRLRGHPQLKCNRERARETQPAETAQGYCNTLGPLRRWGLEGHGELWDTRPCSAYLQQGLQPQAPPRLPGSPRPDQCSALYRTGINPAFSSQPARRVTAPQPIN